MDVIEYVFNTNWIKLSIGIHKSIMYQEPDLNWWHEDFQSSALPAELSRPFSTRRLLHFTKWIGAMSIKNWSKNFVKIMIRIVNPYKFQGVLSFVQKKDVHFYVYYLYSKT